LRALAAARAVNAGEVAARYAGNKEKIPEAIHAARVTAVKAALHDVRD
jgi:tRNA nucleotidyltransferase (CCA-adding enzyme)